MKITYLKNGKKHSASTSNADFTIVKSSSLNEYSSFWEEILELIRGGSFNKLYKKLCVEFNLTSLKKNDKIEALSLGQQKLYKRLAKTLAILIRYSYYVDNTNLYETLAGNEILSTLILEEYLNTYNFKGMELIKAYNLYVSSFNLTGEAYHIYNLICGFGKSHLLSC